MMKGKSNLSFFNTQIKTKGGMMGQYYLVANMDKKQYIQSNGFVKLMEWSYNRNPTVLKLEELINGDWKGDHVYVIGDYADSECADYHADVIQKIEKEYLDGSDLSLYDHVRYGFRRIDYDENIYNEYRYIFNHNTHQYVDMEHCPLRVNTGPFKEHGKWYHATIAPLPLLLALGNGLGGGDYRGNNDHLVGSWAKDSDKLEICEELKFPEYKELQPKFYENELVPYTEKEKRIQMLKQYLKTKEENRTR